MGENIMEISIKYANAMAEVLHYLKGVRIEDINKIPKSLIGFLKNNASKEYKCDFDYTKPLNQLQLLDETKGLIAMICLNYWCETEDQKKDFVKRLNVNEQIYQEKLREKYNPDDIFKNKEESKTPEPTAMVIYKESIFKKFINRIKKFFK